MRRPLYLFAVFLVLYELATYLSNDMILPGMMQVIAEYHATQNYVALSMTYYLLGNCTCILLIGVLAEHFGKRQVILLGNLFFLFCSIAIMFSRNIHMFMAWRFLSGLGLAVISLAYSLIHAHFDDKSAVKLTALMGNITVLAPLAGPAIGSVLVSVLSWRYVFIMTAIMAALSFFGLLKYTPASTVNKADEGTLPIGSGFKAYRAILLHPEFLRGTMLAIFLLMPLMIWISQAPNLILYTLHQSYFHYGIYQVISLGGLAISSVLMQCIADKYSISQLIKIGVWLVIAGLILSLCGFQYIYFVVGGMLIYNLGLGLSLGCVMRIVMSINGVPSGMVSTLFGFIEMGFLVAGIAMANKIAHHYDYSLQSFVLTICFFGLIAALMSKSYIVLYRDRV